MAKKTALPPGVKLLPNGKYEGRRTVHGKAYSRTFGTAGEAHEYYLSLAPEAGEKLTIPTLAEYAETVFEERERDRKSRYVANERSAFRSFHLPFPISQMLITRISRPDLHAHFKALEETKKWEKGSRQVARRNIKMILTHAANAGVIKAHPMAGWRAPTEKKFGDKWSWMTLEEIDLLLAVEHPRECALERQTVYTLAIYTGLRKSEIKRLRWESVNLGARVPTLRVTGETKSQASERSVRLLPPVVAALDAWKRRGGPVRATGIVFPNGCGGEYHPVFSWGFEDHPYVRDGVRKVRPGAPTRAGIRPMRFHDMRHTCASHLIQGSWTSRPLEPMEVRDWMGHSSLEVTERYAHLEPGGVDDLVIEAAKRWGSWPKKASK